MSREYPKVELTDKMIIEAEQLVEKVKVNRTIASEIDTLTGILGEFAFAEFLFGDWRQHRVGSNKGEVDFPDIEIKTSAFPFRDDLNLLVREDYAAKRKPAFYVQIVIDVPSRNANEIKPGTLVYICGFAASHEVDIAPMKDFGSKIAKDGGYRCHYITLSALQSMEEFRTAYKNLHSNVEGI